MERCEQCGANLAMVGRVHRCIPKIVEVKVAPQTVVTLPSAKPGLRLTVKAGADGLVVSPPTSEVVHLRRGRPRIGEVRDKPWVEAGMSRATWYRRKADARPK